MYHNLYKTLNIMTQKKYDTNTLNFYFLHKLCQIPTQSIYINHNNNIYMGENSLKAILYIILLVLGRMKSIGGTRGLRGD